MSTDFGSRDYAMDKARRAITQAFSFSTPIERWDGTHVCNIFLSNLSLLVRYLIGKKLPHSNMISIYRVEHARTRKGPFQTDTEFTNKLAEKASSRRHLKLPHDDGLGLSDIPWTYVFGCEDVATLRKWFLLGENEEENEKICGELKNLGFVMYEFLVEDDQIIKGESGIQLAFDRLEAVSSGLVVKYDTFALI